MLFKWVFICKLHVRQWSYKVGTKTPNPILHRFSTIVAPVCNHRIPIQVLRSILVSKFCKNFPELALGGQTNTAGVCAHASIHNITSRVGLCLLSWEFGVLTRLWRWWMNIFNKLPSPKSSAVILKLLKTVS